jgi:hypothetical protein
MLTDISDIHFYLQMTFFLLVCPHFYFGNPCSKTFPTYTRRVLRGDKPMVDLTVLCCTYIAVCVPKHMYMRIYTHVCVTYTPRASTHE